VYRVITCRVLGPVEVTVDDGPAPAELLWRKHLALLIYLARSPHGTRQRAHLVSLLWGDKPEQSARHSLNEALRVLRRCCGEAVHTEGESVRLDGSSIEMDLESFEEFAAQGEWDEAARLTAGEFMEGFSVPGASAFEEWLYAERTAWRGRGVEALSRFATSEAAKGNLAVASRAANAALELAPTADRAAQAVMRCLALSGDRAGALTRYEEFVAKLDGELGAPPEQETEDLAGNIRLERAGIEEGVDPPEAHADTSRRAPLVGRAEELAVLLETLRASIHHSHSSFLVIEGDAGSGKSRLGLEILARARLDGAAVISIRGVEGDGDIPGTGLLNLALDGLLAARGVAGATPAALAALADRAPQWAERFPATGETTALPLSAAFGDILQAITEEQPVLIAVDDAHWIDRDSLVALLKYLRDLEQARFTLLLTTTPARVPDELERVRATIGRDVRGAVVTLKPWDKNSLAELARWYLPQYSDAELDRVVRRLVIDSAGLPLLAVEILHAVSLGMDIRDQASAWPEQFRTLDETLPGDLPDAIRAAIRMGYRQLSEECQTILAAIAVIGERITPEDLVAATEFPLPTLHRQLDVLEWERWLVSDALGYSFVARIPRDVVSEDMVTEGQRQRFLRTTN
jgi:DNA-binding SARP family transcriptional activator